MRPQMLGHIKKVTLSRPAGEDDNFHCGRFTMQRHRNLQTVHVRHKQVRYDESGRSLLALAEPLMTLTLVRKSSEPLRHKPPNSSRVRSAAVVQCRRPGHDAPPDCECSAETVSQVRSVTRDQWGPILKSRTVALCLSISL